MRGIAIDFETFYSSEYSVRDLGVYGYVQDPRFETYLVAIYGQDEYGNTIEYVGDPVNAPWKTICGMPWWSHNAQFDSAVYRRFLQTNYVTRATPSVWNCTADLCSYFQVPRTLKGAAEILLNKEISKDYRVTAEGKRGEDFTPEEWDEICEAGISDAVTCYELAKKHARHWPEVEQHISRITRQHSYRGVQIDWEAAEADLDFLRRVNHDALNSIPWITATYGKVFPGERPWEDFKPKSRAVKPLSPKALKTECEWLGIEYPSSLAKDSDELADWVAKYGSVHKFVQAMRDYRRTNTFIKKYEAMKRISVKGTLPTYLRYYGASVTGRWGGSSYGKEGQKDPGFNLQNLGGNAVKRGDTYGTDMRKCLIPREGKSFVIADLSQIEPRCLWFLAKDTESLELAKKYSPYEAHARSTMGWTGGVLKDEDPAMYALAKMRVLGLGYGAGWKSFLNMVTTFGEDPAELFVGEHTAMEYSGFKGRLKAADKKVFDGLSKEDKSIWIQAWKQVCEFRASNPKIKDFWDQLDYDIRRSVGKKQHIIRLPSGRRMRYWEPKIRQGGVTAHPVKGYPQYHYYYGGMLTENLTQATARDVFGYALVEIEKQFPRSILWTVHDEVVLEFDSGIAEEAAERVREIMSTTPSWLEGCPLDADVSVEDHYTK